MAGVTVMALLVVVRVAVSVGEVERQERDGGHAAGDQEHGVEPPLVEAEPVPLRVSTKQGVLLQHCGIIAAAGS